MNNMDLKRNLRREVLSLRDNIPEKERERGRILITERICNHQMFCSSDILLAFVNYGSEIDTQDIISEALKKGKVVYVPRVEGEDMNFYRINSLEDLCVGYKGIREPAEGAEAFLYSGKDAEKVLMLMPGAVFDEGRNRIGYGKGFYDRYLSDKAGLQIRTIGIGYKCQLVKELPAQDWDIKPYQVICV